MFPALFQAVEDPNAVANEEKAVQLQRRHQMDAAIVRIMKARKTMKHALLQVVHSTVRLFDFFHSGTISPLITLLNGFFERRR